MILIHLLSMYIIGYIKQLWEGSHKEEVYQKLYFALNIILCGATTVITRSFIPLLLIFIPTIGAFLIIVLWQLIFRLITIFIAWKIFILFAFIISIPLIVVGADNGMNFIELFSVVK